MKEGSDMRHGLYEIRDSLHNLLEQGVYQDGVLHGTRTIYHPDGTTPMVIETYEKGQFDGPYKTYHRNGNVELAGEYISGVMTGEWKGFYDNNQLKEVVRFENNMEQGPFKEYYMNGNLKAEGAYLNGPREHGELLLYDTLGILERKMMCDNGRCATTWTPDEN